MFTLNEFRKTALMAVAAMLFAGAAQAATCDPSAVTVTDVDNVNVADFSANSCAGVYDGNLSDGDLVDGLNAGIWSVDLGDDTTAYSWSFLDKDEDSGDQGGAVEAGIDLTNGTWMADFSPYEVDVFIVLMKASNEFALFLFNDFEPIGALFEGEFDTWLGGFWNNNGGAQELSHLEVAGVYIGVVPLPAAGLMLLGGLAGLGFAGRRRKTA